MPHWITVTLFVLGNLVVWPIFIKFAAIELTAHIEENVND